MINYNKYKKKKNYFLTNCIYNCIAKTIKLLFFYYFFFLIKLNKKKIKNKNKIKINTYILVII